MKKALGVILSILVIALMFLNLEINANSITDNDIRLKNIDALACYTVDDGGQYMGECCWPYWDPCYVVDLQNTLPGDWNI